MGNPLKALSDKGSRRLSEGFQQNYPQLLGMTLEAFSNQALRACS
jgi:hypothetical protein